MAVLSVSLKRVLSFGNLDQCKNEGNPLKTELNIGIKREKWWKSSKKIPLKIDIKEEEQWNLTLIKERSINNYHSSPLHQENTQVLKWMIREKTIIVQFCKIWDGSFIC